MMSAAILPMPARHTAGLMHTTSDLPPLEQLNVIDQHHQPHRPPIILAQQPAASISTTTSSPTITPSLQLPALNITSTSASRQQNQFPGQHNSQQSQQTQHLSLPRPVSFVQQQRRLSQYTPQSNPPANHRLSLHPQHRSARPVSQISQTPSFASQRTSIISTASFADTLVASPQTMTSQYSHHNMYPSHPPPMNNMSRRTPSNASNTSSQHESIRRSSSSRSSNVSSYVALLRKQKATVWCDRSQAEDPRIMAAQRLAKERAERAVAALPSQSSQAHHLHGSNGNNSVSGSGGAKRTPPSSTAGSFTTGVARKIRHHGAQKATTYAGGNMAGAGVPMRLSATEIDDDDDDEGAGERLGSLRNPMDDVDWDAQFYGAGPIRGLHTRTASGQSRSNYAGAGGNTAIAGTGNKLDNYSASSPPGIISSPDDDMTPGNSRLAANKDYFSTIKKSAATTTTSKGVVDDAISKAVKDDELRRRGSVDERAMTLSAGRLFVANPDMDSD